MSANHGNKIDHGDHTHPGMDTEELSTTPAASALWRRCWRRRAC